MKVGEILRNIADQIDAAQAKASAEAKVMQAQQAGDEANAQAQMAAQDAMSQINDLAPEPEAVQVDNTDNTDNATMVPPLQQKHELLKQAGGIDNEVDAFSQGEAEPEADDELALLKKMAGIGEPQQDPNVAQELGPVSINPKKNAVQMHFASDNYDAE